MLQCRQLSRLHTACTVTSAAWQPQLRPHTSLSLLSVPDTSVTTPLKAATKLPAASSPDCLLQTITGNEAVAECADEFQELFREVHADVWKDYKRDPAAYGNRLTFSYDHASFHDAAEDQLDILPEQRAPLSPVSPDMHRVPEILIRRLKALYYKRLSRDPKVRTPEQARNLLLEVASEVVTKEAVAKLVKAIPKTLESIIQEGGNWAAKGLR